MWVASTYMASISVAQEVKWCWFVLSLVGLTAYVLTLVRTFKVNAEARSEGVSQVHTTYWNLFFSWPTNIVVFGSGDRSRRKLK